ncbi:FAD-dependent oxidoreductase [Saccharopolyspora spinosporotrichia]
MTNVVSGYAAKLHLPLIAARETSAVLSVPGRFWNWTARRSGGSVAPVLNGFIGSLPAIDRLGVRDSPAAWVRATQEVHPDLDFADGEPLTTVWTDDPYARGAYSAHAPAFSQADADALEAPIGAVHFAGSTASRSSPV